MAAVTSPFASVRLDAVADISGSSWLGNRRDARVQAAVRMLTRLTEDDSQQLYEYLEPEHVG